MSAPEALAPPGEAPAGLLAARALAGADPARVPDLAGASHHLRLLAAAVGRLDAGAGEAARDEAMLALARVKRALKRVAAERGLD